MKEYESAVRYFFTNIYWPDGRDATYFNFVEVYDPTNELAVISRRVGSNAETRMLHGKEEIRSVVTMMLERGNVLQKERTIKVLEDVLF